VISSIVVLSPAPHRARCSFQEAEGFSIFPVIAQHAIKLMGLDCPIEVLSPVKAAISLVISSLNAFTVLLREYFFYSINFILNERTLIISFSL